MFYSKVRFCDVFRKMFARHIRKKLKLVLRPRTAKRSATYYSALAQTNGFTEDDFLFGTFPDGFVWGVSSAAYSVRLWKLSLKQFDEAFNWLFSYAFRELVDSHSDSSGH